MIRDIMKISDIVYADPSMMHQFTVLVWETEHFLGRLRPTEDWIKQTDTSLDDAKDIGAKNIVKRHMVKIHR